MTKIIMSIAEIQEEIQNRINQIPELIEDGATVRIMGIQRLAQLDERGCNWTANHFSNSTGYEYQILKIVSTVQEFVNLSE